VTASSDGTIFLRDLSHADAAPVVFRGHRGVLEHLVFHPDGSRLISGGTDGSIRVWTMELPALIAVASERAGRNLTLSEWQRFLPDTPYRKTFEHLPGADQ
jgi:WD40 repeat protein